MFASLSITAREKGLHYILQKDCHIPAVPMHWHSEYEIVYASRGSFRCLVESREYTVSEGNAIIVAGGDRHYYFPSPDSLLTRIVFSSDILAGACCSVDLVKDVTEKLRTSSRSTEGWPEEAMKDFRDVLFWLSEQNGDSDDAAYQLAVRGGTFLLLSLFLKYSGEVQDLSSSPVSDCKVMERIEKVFTYVSENYASDISLSSAAAVADYVPTYFSRIFREYTGMTFYSYLTAYRVAIAEQELVLTNDSISDIAVSAGFGSVKTFDRIFKEKKGIPPLRFRKMMKKGSQA